MSTVVSAERVRVDACPGALTVHAAADGGLARIRLPGGTVSAAQLAALATATEEFGDGRLELTSRGNVQIRGLAAGAEVGLGAHLAAIGLLPSASHERVRNIVASPLSGIDGDGDLTALVAALDAGLCARPGLAVLPGRFLFGLDDGRGDVAGLGPDVALHRGGDGFEVSGVSRVSGVSDARADPGLAVELMLAFAQAFLDERSAQRSAAWRVAELPGGVEAVRGRVLRGRPDLCAVPLRPPSTPPDPPAGIIDQPDGQYALAVLAPLGRVSAAHLRAVAGHAGARGVRITPWRSVVVPDLSAARGEAEAVAAELNRLGLGTDAGSPWYRVSACTGRPGCAKALADVQADARAAALTPARTAAPVHWSGCERRCGRPHDTQVDRVATGAGYDVTPARTDAPDE